MKIREQKKCCVPLDFNGICCGKKDLNLIALTIKFSRGKNITDSAYLSDMTDKKRKITNSF